MMILLLVRLNWTNHEYTYKCSDRFFGDRPYRPIIRNNGYSVTGNIVDPKWLHINVEEKEREEEKWKMKRRRTTRKFEQSPSIGSSFSVKGRSVKSIARNALFYGLNDLFSEDFNDDSRFEIGKTKIIIHIYKITIHVILSVNNAIT